MKYDRHKTVPLAVRKMEIFGNKLSGKLSSVVLNTELKPYMGRDLCWTQLNLSATCGKWSEHDNQAWRRHHVYATELTVIMLNQISHRHTAKVFVHD